MDVYFLSNIFPTDEFIRNYKKGKAYCVDVSRNVLKGLMFGVTTNCLSGSINGYPSSCLSSRVSALFSAAFSRQ